MESEIDVKVYSDLPKEIGQRRKRQWPRLKKAREEGKIVFFSKPEPNKLFTEGQFYDIIFLQETYSTVDVEDIWKTQWQGKLHSAHGSNHSCGGRSIIMEAEVQGSLFLFVNIYAPNKVQDQCRFFENLNKNIEHFAVNK
ncbi:unnamed protein product, partial [Pocillopora meandrina]